MRVLVTGNSGHVGGAIATHLANNGWEVVGLSRTFGKVKGLAQQVQADISSPSFVEHVSSATSPCAAIVHAAAVLDKDLYAPAISLTNSLGSQQMLELAQMWGMQSFVYISSIGVIGIPQQLPITEEHPTNPPTAYHAAKLYGEHLTEIARRNGLTAAILRLTSPVGPGMPDNRILSVFVRRALANEPLQLTGQGSRRQNYVDVRDVALAVEHCLQHRVAGLSNIGGRYSISNRDLAQLSVRLLGSSSPITSTGQSDPEEGIVWEVSIAKAAKCFGYDPQHSIEESIRAVGADYAAGAH
ncbi:MAG: NAD(P)-dependent oxidoreductase [Lentisphaerae bacterium]|nr:NAD(P)-dependent oxidoreductase [Lentisphaerota bacterium]